MSTSSGSVDFLVSYTSEDRDWAEWIASHLGAMGYSYALQEPPSAAGTDPFMAAEAAMREGEDVIIVLSLAFIEALLTSGAQVDRRLTGPGRAVAVQIEAVQAPPELRGVPIAPMHQAADDYAASRDFLLNAVRAVRAAPSGHVDQRVPLPAPTALAESYPVAPPPSGPAPALLSARTDTEAGPNELLTPPLEPTRSVGLLFGGRANDRIADGTHADDPFEQRSGVDDAGDDRPPPLFDYAARGRDNESGLPTTQPEDSTDDLVDEAGTVEEAEASEAVAVEEAEASEAESVEEALAAGLIRLPHPRPAFFHGRGEELAALASGLPSQLTDAGEGSENGVSADEQSAGAADSSAAGTAASAAGAPVVTLIGPAGSGKTTLAAEHAYRHLDELDVVWWVRAASRASLLADLRALGGRLGLGGDTPEQQVNGVKEWLEQTGQRWLVVFDGVVSGHDVADVLPESGRGQVVITTANRGFEGAGEVVEVSGFSVADGTSFLLTRASRHDERGAANVARRLGGSAAALEMASCYAMTTGSTFGAYLDVLDDTSSPPQLNAATPVASAEWCVLAALRAISDARRSAAPALVTLATATADAPVPRPVAAAVGAPAGSQVLDLFCSYGVVVADDDVAVVPSAVRQALAYLVPAGSSPESWRKLIDALDDAATNAGSTGIDALAPHAARVVRNPDAEPTPQLARLAALATSWSAEQGALDEAVVLGEQALELHDRTFGEDDDGTREARRRLAELYVGVGDTPRAVVTQAAVLADCEQAFGPDDGKTVDATAALAASYAELRDYARAVSYGERAIAGLERLRGDQHPDTIAARAVLSGSRSALADATLFAPDFRLPTSSRPAALEPQLEPQVETVASWRGVDTGGAGPEAPNGHTPDLENAPSADGEREPAAHQPDAPSEPAAAAGGAEGPAEAAAAEDAAADEGPAEAALAAEDAVAAGGDAVRGAAQDVPAWLTNLNQSIGATPAAEVNEPTSSETGLLASSEIPPLTSDDADSTAEAPRDAHPAEDETSPRPSAMGAPGQERQTSTTAALQSDQPEPQPIPLSAATSARTESVSPTAGDATASDDIRRLTAELQEIESGGEPLSHEAITVRHQLAIAHSDAGDNASAVALLTTVVGQCEQLLGDSHLDTLTARANLASAHAELGNADEAISCQERVVADYERLLGADDPQTLAARNALANDYATAGLTESALVTQQRVAADYERILGRSHPRTVTAQHNLANSFAELGNHELALELRLKVLSERERDLGIDHPQTLGARNNLANSYADLGQHDRALELRSEVLEARERVLGPDHPHTLTARNNLANSYAAMGRHDEALALREQALVDCERVLGSGHPHTITARNNLANTWAALGDDARAQEIRTSSGRAGGSGSVSAGPRGRRGADPFSQASGGDTRVLPAAGAGAQRQNGHQGEFPESRNGHVNQMATAPVKSRRKRRFWFWAR